VTLRNIIIVMIKSHCVTNTLMEGQFAWWDGVQQVVDR